MAIVCGVPNFRIFMVCTVTIKGKGFPQPIVAIGAMRVRGLLQVLDLTEQCWPWSNCSKSRSSQVSHCLPFHLMDLQSTLIISKSKGPSETLRDIRSSTYQMCGIEENTNRTNKFHKRTCNVTPLVRNIWWKIVENGRNCSWGAISPLIHNILLPEVRFLC